MFCAASGVRLTRTKTYGLSLNAQETVIFFFVVSFARAGVCLLFNSLSSLLFLCFTSCVNLTGSYIKDGPKSHSAHV